MIWTIVCFADHAVRAQALRVRPDPEDDRRAARADPESIADGRPRARGGAEAARRAPRLIGPGARARPRRSASRCARRGVARANALKRRWRTTASGASRRPSARSRRRRIASLGADPAGGRRADAARRDEGDRQGARLRRPAPPDRRGDLVARLQRARGEDARLDGGRTPHVRARPLRGREGAGPPRDGARGARRLRRRDRRVPELDAMLRNPQIDPRAKAQTLDDILGGADELVRNFLLLIVEKNRGGQLREIHSEFERLIAARGAAAHRGPDDGVRALRRGGAADRRPDRAGVRPAGRRDAHASIRA